MRITVGICDDKDAYRQVIGICIGLAPDLELVGEGRTGREAIELAVDRRPDVLLLDVAMPIMDGLTALPAIREAAPDVSVIMLTGFADPRTRERAMLNGAHDYIEKGATFDEIAMAIRSCMVREAS